VISNSQAAENWWNKLKDTRGKRWVFLGLWGLAFVVAGILVVAVTDTAVVWSSSNRFCGTACHWMTWASEAYKRGPHYHQVGVSASCGQCHIPYDSGRATPTQYVKLLFFKADRGAKDFWYESRKAISTQQEWEKRRPVLRAKFEQYLTSHSYITCRGCHALDSFDGPRSQMKALIHKDVINAAPPSIACSERTSRKMADGTPTSRRRTAPELMRTRARVATEQTCKAAPVRR